ncbi:Vps62 protein [Saccharomycopsis crataegensis]|uniref:Vps62 protein n=1 Tax=Saccharomycopsis crataegensis TaxID=43959 RepID=A0AAV5QG47_9ASCO|nr:Vps62 protein [Saccharomycopsis crataegensis]
MLLSLTSQASQCIHGITMVLLNQIINFLLLLRSVSCGDLLEGKKSELRWPAPNFRTSFGLSNPWDDHDTFALLQSKTQQLPPIITNPDENQTTILPGDIPDYVLNFAPLVHLYSEERYLPYDINKFVSHLYLQFGNGTNLTTHADLPLNLSRLADFAQYSTEEQVFMTSLEDYSVDPEWITGKHNKPRYENGEITDAPAVLIVVDKGNGWVDSYWFYFYSFNLGPFVMGCGPYGNHVGDWEHSLVRFYDGTPTHVWMSAHGGGNGYKFDAVEKFGEFDQGEWHNHPNSRRNNGTKNQRPVIFSARGTHANYASVGQHAHDLPYSILSDFTDRGPLWDPAMNYLAYTWDGVNLVPSLNKTSRITNNTDFIYKYNNREREYGPWLFFMGQWGDKKMDPKDPRQVWSPWEYKYIDGPRGPLAKNLLRENICQRSKWWNFWDGCTVRNHLNMGSGIESEGANTCITISNKISNPIIRLIFSWISYGGWICFIVDNFWA